MDDTQNIKSYENEVSDCDIEESFGIERLFSEYVVINVPPSDEEHDDVQNIMTTNEKISETERSNADKLEEENQDFVHPELRSIFMNFDEFAESSSTLKQTATEAEPGYLYLLPSVELDDDYLKHCNVCLDFQSDVAFCSLCTTSICFSCLGQYFEHSIMDGIIEFNCPSDESCAKMFSEQIVAAFVKSETFAILTKNKVDADKNPNIKTCPGCHKVTQRSSVKQSQKGQENSRINCSCGTYWCFSCYSPWHTGVSCKSYQKDVVSSGDKALRFWAKVGRKGRKNARKCPKCKIYIERTAGCDHMYCKRCDTNFCYRCGCKHYNLGMVGNHFSTYSFLGCKYNLHPNKPVLRIAKRTGVFVGVVILSPIALGGLTIAATVGIPTILIYKKCCK